MMIRWTLSLSKPVCRRLAALSPAVAVAVTLVAACDAPRRPVSAERDALGPALRQRLIRPDAFAENHSEPNVPLRLDRAIAEALAASGQLEQMQRRIEAAGQQIRQAEAAFYPRLVLAQDYNITDNPVYAMMHIINQRRLDPTTNFNDPGRQQNFATQIRSEMLLLDAGGRSANRKVAQQQRRAGESERLAVRNRLVGTVTETYYRWLQARQFVRVAQLALEQAQTNERLGQIRLEAAAALQSELMRLKTRTAESRGNLVSARIGARRLQAALERLLARPIAPAEMPEPDLDPFTPTVEPPHGNDTLPAETAVDPDSFAPTVEPPEPNRQALVERALRQRPELEAAAYLIQASRARVQAAKSDLWPQLSAFAQYQLDSEQWDRWQDSWMVGVQAGWNLFEGGLTRARLIEARALLREQESRQIELALDIALEVTQASLALTEAQEKITVARQRRGWAAKALAETRLLYQQEMVTVDALLQAQLDWNRAETAYAAAVFDGRIAHALLRQSLGDFAERMEPANPSVETIKFR